MGPVQHEPEIQFAQRLASNEKPIRTQAIKKLRKYITYRSQKVNGGFTGDELLKLWKGLFYCLWMQDKPLLQEELSEHISGLIHLFQTVDGQFLFLEAFIQTVNREWTGIDRLRMDKFFQLVRFVFRQTFELLKKKNWETSLVTRFLELLTSRVLHSASGAPSGLQFHIMDVYMAELAKVGSNDLTAEQNMTFIDPFCKTAAKTKNRILLRAICSSIFSTIIDQAPFAIEELMNEMKAAGGDSDSDSGQASQDEEEEEEHQAVKVKTDVKIAPERTKRKTEKQANGSVSKEETDKDDDDDDESLHLENDAMFPDDGGCGPVLQFDYGALADRLFGLAKRIKTPSFNRQRLYKVIKALRDLIEGEFPQDEYPEEVSTDEDDDEMFGSRKRMKRGPGLGEDDGPAAKKSKKKDVSKPEKSNKSSTKDNKEPTYTTPDATQKKKRKKRKKKIVGGDNVSAELTGGSEVNVSVTISVTELDTPALTSQTMEGESKDTEESTEFTKTDIPQSTPSDVEALQTGKQTETVAPPEEFCTEKIENEIASTMAEDQCQTPLARHTSTKKAKKRKESEMKTVASEPCEEVRVVEVDATEIVPEKTTTTTRVKKGKKSLKIEENTEVVSKEQAEPVGTEIELKPTSCTEELPSADASPILLKKKKAAAPKKQVEATKGEETDGNVEMPHCAETGKEPLREAMGSTPLNKKKKKTKMSKRTQQAEDEENQLEQPMEIETAMPIKKKKKKPKVLAQEVEIVDLTQSENSADKIPPEEVSTESQQVTPSKNGKKKKKKKKGKDKVVVEAEEMNAVETIAIMSDLAKEDTGVKKSKMKNDSEVPATAVKKSLKKKTKAGSSDFITFQSNPTVPTPLFCKAKGSPTTPLSSKKKCQTPSSELKKVTFGLKNNKTAEFRKNDRSLLVSPDGSSRVPFDPQQKPRFGVLKSPARSLNSGSKIKKSTPKGRPTAADFF
ncbi:ribosomal RNA processing protein 1 homolog B [Aplochiton taeniatus]